MIKGKAIDLPESESEEAAGHYTPTEQQRAIDNAELDSPFIAELLKAEVYKGE